MLDEVVPVEHEGVQAGDHERFIAPFAGLAPEAEARIVPGRGQDGGFALRAEDGEEMERFVAVVDPADRHHDVPDADIELRGEALLEPQLLQRHLAALLDLALPLPGFGVFLFDGRAGAAVFEFDLGLHRPAPAEIVAEENHGVRDVEAGVPGIRFIICRVGVTVDVVTVEIARERDLAVAADGQAALLLRHHLRGKAAGGQEPHYHKDKISFHMNY